MTLCDLDKYAFIPKRCSRCGRRFWLEPYRAYFQEEEEIRDLYSEHIECLDCFLKAQKLANKSANTIKEQDLQEFIGQIIDVFEDFLDDRKIQVDNPEQKETDDPVAIIYGSDYGELRDKIENILKWRDLIGG